MKSLLHTSVLGIASSFALAAPVIEVVAEFERPPTSPLAALVLAGDGNFYGTTSGGGWNDRGTIFRMTPAGALTVLVHFTGTNGAVPVTGLTVGPDGSLYGTSSAGGANGLGTIFKMTTAGALTTLVNFSGSTAPAKGGVPSGELHLAADGNFYGTTSAGGVNDLGTVFKMTPTGTLTTLKEFTGTSGSGKGAEPRGRLAADAAGTTLFGVCGRGGADDLGSVFKITTSGTFTSLKEFTGASGNTKGESPSGGLVRATDGNYYGVTESGGADDLGTVFKITSGGNLTTLADGSTANGGAFNGALFQAADGNLYGTAGSGGTEDLGAVFRITTGGAFTVVHSFIGDEGFTPRSALVAGADGALYAPASAGGPGLRGTLFKISTTGVFAKLADFAPAAAWSPAGGLTPAADGTMLATFTEGGTAGFGVVSRITNAGVVTPVVSFSGLEGADRGAEPVGALLATTSGDYYGLTRRGGVNDGGTAFRISADDTFTSLSGFGSTTGQFPEDTLTLGSDGFFYATAGEGGVNGLGTIFKMTQNGARTRLISFTGISGTAPGARPNGTLTAGDNGDLFGTTAEGGTSDIGTLFRLTATGELLPLVQFTGANGATPLGALVRSVDGNFYGTTSAGGGSNLGTVFRLSPVGTLTTLAQFTGASGAARGAMPAGTLLCAPDGTLYGTTTSGGTNGFGTVFRISSSGVHSTLFDLTGTNGAGGPSAPVFASDGNLYAASPDGGPRGGGVVYRIRQFGPHIGTEAPSMLTNSSATFSAMLISGGETTTVSFEYGSTTALGSETSGAASASAHPEFILAGLTPGQEIFYRAKATNASGTSLGVIRSFVVPTAFAVWKTAALGNANADDLSDIDGDGLSLLHEYALSLSPTVSDASAMPSAELRAYAEGKRLAVVISRDPAHNDITLEVQSASDVAGTWTTIASSINGAPFSGAGYFAGETGGEGIKTVEIRDTVNITDAPQRFIRLRFQH